MVFSAARGKAKTLEELSSTEVRKFMAEAIPIHGGLGWPGNYRIYIYYIYIYIMIPNRRPTNIYIYNLYIYISEFVRPNGRSSNHRDTNLY